MRRILLAALAALIAWTAPASARGGSSYVYVPIYIPSGPVGPNAPEPGNYDRIHKVAVITAIGTTFDLEKPQFLGPKTASIDVAAWQVDDHVKQALVKYLGGKFTFVDVPYNQAGLARIRPTIWHAGELSSFLKTVPSDGIDAFIVVRPGAQGGMRLESADSGRATLWVDYRMEIIDAHTLKTIGESSSRYQVREGAAPGFPGLMLGKDYAFDNSMKLAPERIEKLHKLTIQLLDITLVETIRSLQFGVSLPPVGDHSLLPPPPTSRSMGVKTIALISAIGDQLHLHVPGGMLTKDFDRDVPFADAGIDDEVEATVRGLLAKDYVFKSAPIDRSALAKKWWDMKDGKPVIAVPPAPDVDAYLLIVKDEMKAVSGPGVWHDGNWTSDWTYVFCNYLVLLVDAHTLTPIVATRGVMSSNYSHAGPSFKVPNNVWPKKNSDPLPAEATPLIRNTVMLLMRDSLPETLYRTGLNLGSPAAPGPEALQPAQPQAPEPPATK